MRLIVVSVKKEGITVDGHAGYAKTGNDIICAAVSVLSQDGHIDIKYKNLSEQGKLLVDSFFIAICDISNTYGTDYVKIA